MCHITASRERQVLLVADAHLPLDDRPFSRLSPSWAGRPCYAFPADEQRQIFRNMLENEGKTAQVVILLGDIFDFWYEWENVIPKRAVSIFYVIHELIRNGSQVHFFAGNHDFRIQGFLETEVGMILHPNQWSAEINQRRVYFNHGDGFAPSDRGYRRLKKTLRNHQLQALFGKLFHPDLAMNLGRFASLGGRSRYNYLPDHKRPDGEYLITAQKILAGGYDLVIIGHTHHQKLVQLQGGWYHNPGPFMYERCYSVIHDDLPIGKIWKL